jgi:PhzF family phenazine biosynthesis protein
METYIVDAFTAKAFKGNPAGVCLVTAEISVDLMQHIAMELNLSETAFVQQISKNHFNIRYFSPKTEIPLCGHATLGAAKVLFQNSELTNIQFTTHHNLDLFVQKKGDEIEMIFPVYETEKVPENHKMLAALGISKVENCVFNKENQILLLEISDTNTLANLNPDFLALVNSNQPILGVTVTAQSKNDDFDFHSRFFWPWSGSNEDPVTGVAHTILSKYWSKKLHKTTLKAFQASQRTGFMHLEITNNNKLLIKSNATIVFKGNLVI